MNTIPMNITLKNIIPMNTIISLSKELTSHRFTRYKLRLTMLPSVLTTLQSKVTGQRTANSTSATWSTPTNTMTPPTATSKRRTAKKKTVGQYRVELPDCRTQIV